MRLLVPVCILLLGALFHCVEAANLQFGMRAGWNSTALALEAGSA
jgi:hypothetical protein